jgi:CDP-diacylglycerol--serine O-phosphatidyltransferase
MFIKKQIPNLFTLANLFSGCLALFYVFQSEFFFTFFFVSLGIFFDFFDGFFARMLKVESPLGLQLDSLADMVTSGVVPGFVMFFLLQQTESPLWIYLPFTGFIIILASAYRLAKFNIDTRQTDSFIGLPTPANALLICSLPLVLQTSDSIFIQNLITSDFILISITLLSAFMLNAEIPLFSLKIKNFTFQKYQLQVFFLIFSLLCLLLFQYLAIPIIILNYVLWSFIHTQFFKK